ncbi:group III truncated hemoglobin [Apibacter raozihei]|uniref:group III truncated hemoglobin n=1 Tax=Apibacter TaxID=1778601 RepID=UPI000FE2FE3D|nr:MULTISPECIES: group III truncated hemoglobin [Apibacter]
MKNDIEGINDIKQMVDTFYSKIRKDDLLKDIFENIIQDNWTSHLEKMYRFWQTVILKEHTYYGSPFAPHSTMPVTKIHFDRWIDIFIKNIDEQFSGINADETKKRAVSMANLFNSKLEYYRQNNNKPIM